MAVQTGNGSSAAFLSWIQSGTAIVALQIDMGTQTRTTIRYTPLKTASGEPLEIAKKGDSITGRTISIRGLLDIADIPTNGPDLEALTTDDCTVSLPTAGKTYRDTGHFESIEGPNLIVDELMEVNVMFVTSNEGGTRGWASV